MNGGASLQYSWLSQTYSFVGGSAHKTHPSGFLGQQILPGEQPHVRLEATLYVGTSTLGALVGAAQIDEAVVTVAV